MRATYMPEPAAAERGAAGGVRLVVTTRGDASDGELVVYRPGRRQGRTLLTATQLRGLLQQWAAAARDGRGELVVGD